VADPTPGARQLQPARAAFLIAKAEDEKAVRDWIAGDPYMVHGLTEDLTITAWDPIFGAFASESSLAGVSYEDLRRQILARFAALEEADGAASA
jgi:hypothetical protein